MWQTHLPDQQFFEAAFHENVHPARQYLALTHGFLVLGDQKDRDHFEAYLRATESVILSWPALQQTERRLDAMGIEKYKNLLKKNTKNPVWNGVVKEDNRDYLFLFSETERLDLGQIHLHRPSIACGHA